MAAAILRATGARASLGSSRWSFHDSQSLRVDVRRFFSSYLVTPKQLHEALKKNPPISNKINTLPRTIPLCAAWFLPNDGRNGLDTFRAKRIPNARFFDLDKVIDRHSPYPHMLPSASEFASAMSALGIRRDDTVVVYDTQELGIFSAPRVGWTLKVFGHDQVHILNNFRIWVEEGYPTESGEFYSVDACPYPIPTMDESKAIDFARVKEIAHDHNKEGAEGVQILDARSYERWAGTSPEPRPGLSSGHMPGSISIPFTNFLDPKTKAFLPAGELRKIFESRGVDPLRPIVSTCGTGTTAAVINAALDVAEYGDQKNHKLYDGSWT